MDSVEGDLAADEEDEEGDGCPEDFFTEWDLHRNGFWGQKGRWIELDLARYRNGQSFSNVRRNRSSPCDRDWRPRGGRTSRDG